MKKPHPTAGYIIMPTSKVPKANRVVTERKGEGLGPTDREGEALNEMRRQARAVTGGMKTGR